MLTPADIDRSGLTPCNYTTECGKTLHLFRDSHLDMVKIDFSFQAGSALQHKKLQASATLNMLVEGTRHHTAREIAEMFDSHGVIVEKNVDAVTACLSVYMLERHVETVLPLLFEILVEPSFPDAEFAIYMAKRRQQLQTSFQKTSYISRNMFYSSLYGSSHPVGVYATVDDADLLEVEDIRNFFSSHYDLAGADIILSGNVTDRVLKVVDRCLDDAGVKGNLSGTVFANMVLPEPQPEKATGFLHAVIPNAVQNTLRVGRILPIGWDSMDYSRFMLLSTVLGGYFGSRLMSNIREDKGYTYGVNAFNHVFRGSISFYITTDVAADKSEAAMAEIISEIERLRHEPVPEEELQLVRQCMLGDFMRSIDGIFERSERYRNLVSSGLSELFTDNLMAVVGDVSLSSAEQLQKLAYDILDPSQLLQISVGR